MNYWRKSVAGKRFTLPPIVAVSLKSLLVAGVILSVLVVSAARTQGETLNQFNSDGCSAFPDGTLSHNELWLACCVAHDFAYWQGGTYQQRLDADLALEQCVASVGEPNIALVMLAGVRVGGTPYLPTTFRWGYGWSYPRFYQKLTSTELAQVARRSARR